jgi:hypothetical protein
MHTDICAASGSPGAAQQFSGLGRRGNPICMTDDRIEQRAAELLPEERAAGSADPEAQAAAILGESDERAHRTVPSETGTPEMTSPEGTR